jgi:tocopherol cyclase
MEHHAPHRRSAFEGYYSKFDLPSGAHLALIICQVRGAKQKPHVVSFTYVPKDGSGDPEKVYQRELWVDNIDMVTFSKDHAFGLEVKDMGYARWRGDSTTEYSLKHEAFSFQAKTTTRTPWSSHTETPESLLVYLPLPLHWHVQSLASECEFELKIPGHDLPAADRSGKAVVHQEKNWAQGFPSAHMWLQARNGDKNSSFCCAGGQILGTEAFLLGYRSKDIDVDFRPPFALRFAGLSPFMSYTSDWNNRTFELSVQSFRRKLTIKASAPKGTFFPLSSPFPEGHRENYLAESFQARFEIKVYKSGWFSPWRLVREEIFENASLEFGGGYYPPAGTDQLFN